METPNPQTPLVTILIVTWNRSDDLLTCIESAKAQTYPNTHILVIDNDSSDGTSEKVRERFADVEMIRSYKNLGCPSGRNLGLANCRGKYVYSLDDDGWLKEDALAIAVQRAEADESLAVVMSQIREMDGEQCVRIKPKGLRESVYLDTFVGCCSLLRRKALDQVGFFPDDFWRQGEEEDMALRLLDKGWRIILEPASVMFHAPSEINRDMTTFRYYAVRNTTKISVRLWPWPWCAYRVASNAVHCFRAVLRGRLLWPVMLTANLLRDLATLKGQRRPVSVRTLKLWRQLRKTPSGAWPQ